MRKMLTPTSNYVINKPKQRAFCLLVCSMMFCAQLCVSVVTSSVFFVGTANAQTVFSWFSSDDDKQQDDLLKEQDITPVVIDQTSKHNAAFGELVYHYFQEDYQQVLQLIEVGNTKHGFTQLSKDDTDRLNLMQGAAQLRLGMYELSQAKFASLLSQTTSDYVQAHTWFFMAKAGFENKQSYLSERAYEAILQGDLREELSNSQWYELLYLTAYTRMQLEQDWQSLASQIPIESIYSAYLLANKGTISFNQANYEQATATFTQAKQALIAYQNRAGFITRVASSVFDSVTWFVTPWTWFDSNATAQQAAKERQQVKSVVEQDALFDRINIGLGQSLLQQGDLANAIAVIQNVADGSAESQQALLTYGWANAEENRWQTAMAAWQHLQQNSVGLFSLQASYGLAYAFGQQDKLGQAFYALESTASQIDSTLTALDDFAKIAKQDTFFSQYNEQWPQALNDIQLGFFAPTQTFDAKYLLAVRLQAEQVKADIDTKQNRVVQLDTLLQEREDVYEERLQSMSLRSAKTRIEQAQQYIDDINALIMQADTFEKQLALSEKMSSSEVTGHLDRLERAYASQSRLAADTTRKRPLKASYKERLDLIEGVLTWQLMDDFIAQQWQHKQLLSKAQASLILAENQYSNLQNITQDHDVFSQQRGQFSALNEALTVQIEAANNVYTSATSALTYQLLTLIEARKTQLKTQGVNTRLAMLRIQDLQQQPGGER
ncbi:MAG: hypothetical protein ACJAVV_003201 [Alphaproteobacteria bacterium]|jgi:hypothetical protein